MKLRLEEPDALDTVHPRAIEVTENYLSGVGDLWQEIVRGGTLLR